MPRSRSRKPALLTWWCAAVALVCTFVLLSGAALALHLAELEAPLRRGRAQTGSLSWASAPGQQERREPPPHERPPPHEWRVGAGRASASFSVRPGGPPSLRSLRWGAGRAPAAAAEDAGWEMDVAAAQPLLVSLAPAGAEADEPRPCRVTASGASSADLDCGGLAATLRVTAHEAGPHGAALRWHVAAASGAAVLSLAAWLPGAAVEGVVDGSPITARRRPQVSTLSTGGSAKASSFFDGRGPERMLDGDGETEWFAAKGTQEAWVEIDLGGARVVSAVQWQWWAASFADEWTLESRADAAADWTQEYTSGAPGARSMESFNPWVRLPALSGPVRHLRLSMCKGHLDPWSFGVFFGIRTLELRRAFHGYLQAARGRPFGQILHYNSWYDLRSAPCADGLAKSGAKESVIQRLEAFNGNLTASRGIPLDAFLLDDGWDNWDSLWEVDTARFPSGFPALVAKGSQWGTRMGCWMSPFGGYGLAGQRRVRFGTQRGFERNQKGSFSLAGPKYFATFSSVVRRRIEEGFGIFKFDGLGGGLGQKGGDAYMGDFEAMLSLIRGVRQERNGDQVWISLTIGTWASPFWLLWGDSIWRDGPDVGGEGVGSQRERWLTFRDAALRRGLMRGPLFPLTSFMQHGVVWSRSGETDDMWPSQRSDPLEDFCNEALSFFLSGTGLQELYVQLELMEARHWAALAAISSYARRELEVLRDAHAIWGGGKGTGTAAPGTFPGLRPDQSFDANPAVATRAPQEARKTETEAMSTVNQHGKDGQPFQGYPCILATLAHQ
ncbi:unnamed protein product [Prorocentrum cordatum]|uniref:F5/8 type C domain-containing protein n=1 Tax=Prorocentrum cordatum TaxID=2364126 RepID=A0ABN9UGH5_9DINO|nr:unnamed protein product [Polarella glacialis]